MTRLRIVINLIASTWLLVISVQFIDCWDNGLAKTPPMGWMSWAKYACEVDCKTYPDDCISEKLFTDMIDRIAEDGYLEAGYNYVNIDDCWMDFDKRDPKTSRLIANATRFPSGIDSLAQYAHSKKVLLGIYEDVGTMTCQRYPGTFFHHADHTKLDAQTFSDWGIDSLKMDGCYAEPLYHYNETYPAYRKALSQVERKILYACSWPAYILNTTDEEYTEIRDNCNYWRNYDDIEDSYASVKSIINYYGEHNDQFRKFHGPGGWFDPDMILVGNNGLSYEESKTQMAFWCMWSAPLLMSNDLRKIRPEFKEILLNKDLIALDQDPLGIMASRVVNSEKGQNQVWVKKLSPTQKNGLNPWAVLYFNDNDLGPATFMSFRLNSIIPELKSNMSYEVYDLFQNHTYLETLKPDQLLKLKVPTSGSVRLVKLIPIYETTM